jgi:hypothetical protein
MKFPPYTGEQTAAGYMTYLHRQCGQVERMWTSYGWTMSQSYTAAYEKMAGKLRGVQQELLLQAQAERENMAFALSLITIGIGGVIAGKLARTASSEVRSTLEAVQKAAKDNPWMKSAGEAAKNALAAQPDKSAEDFTKKVVERLLQKDTDPLINALSPSKDVSSDPFAPKGMSPTLYLTTLQSQISSNSTFMFSILNQVDYNPQLQSVTIGDAAPLPLKQGGVLTLADAKRLTEAMLKATFCLQAPDFVPAAGDLTDAVALALWIAWGCSRDVDYWSTAAAVGFSKAYSEQFLWDPVRAELILLGVDPDKITVQGFSKGGWTQGLNMSGFIEWAKQPTSWKRVFASLRTDPAGIDLVVKKTASMSGTMGWTTH